MQAGVVNPGIANVYMGMGAPADDDELVRRALAPDPTAYAQLYRRYRDEVWSLARRELESRHDADDATQETFLKAWRQLRGYRGPRSFKAWLLRICRNECTDRRRAAKPVLFLECLGEEQLADGACTEDAADWMTVCSAIRRLPADEAMCWFLIDYLGCTSEEAAHVVGVRAASTMRSRLNRARTELDELRRDPKLVPADPVSTAVCGLYHLPPQKAIVAALGQQRVRPAGDAPVRQLEVQPRLVMTQSGERGGWTLVRFFDELERAVPGDHQIVGLLDSDVELETERWRGSHTRWELTCVAAEDSWRRHAEGLLTRCVAASCRSDVSAILALIDAGERFVWTPRPRGAVL